MIPCSLAHSRIAVSALLVLLSTASCSIFDDPPQQQPLPADLRRAHDATILEDGTLRPRWIGTGRDIFTCLEVPEGESTSRWHAILALDRQPDPADPPREPELFGNLACFDIPIPPDLPTSDAVTLHGTIYRGEEPIHQIEPQTFAYDREEGDYREFFSAEEIADCRQYLGRNCSQAFGLKCFQQLLNCKADQTFEDLLQQRQAYNAIERLAVSAGLPLEAIKHKTIAAYYLRHKGSPESLAEAEARLMRLPEWIDQRPADEVRGLVHQARGDLQLARGELREALQSYDVADQLLQRSFSLNRISTLYKQAKIIGQVGSEREAIESLETALESCRPSTCSNRLVAVAHGDNAWWTLLDSRSNSKEIEAAASQFEFILKNLRGEPVELAIQRINQAMLHQRLGRDTTEPLAKALELVEDKPGARAREVRGWAELVHGLEALTAQDSEQALRHCRSATAFAKMPGDPTEGSQAHILAAFGWSCRGRSQQLAGNYEQALEAFETARMLHSQATPEQLGQDISQAPGPRAEAYSRAASVMLEPGSRVHSPREAWQLLGQLDLLPVVGAGVPAEDLAQIKQLQQEISDLEGIASPSERQRRQALIRDKREELRERSRAIHDSPLPKPGKDRELRFRAFAIDDQIFLLHRHDNGRVTARQTPMARQELHRVVDQLTEALAGEGELLDDPSWRTASQALAEALVPDLRQLGETTPYAVHGILQGIPLEALPIADGWFGDHTTVVVRPAGNSLLQPVRQPGGSPLVVVNPTGDLRSGPLLLRFYQQHLPQARVLDREAATIAAFRRELTSASWLHIDAHGRYIDSFPELSSIQLADGDFSISDLDEVWARLEFANLSSCRTSSWPITADAGRYGLAGRVARLGRPWVLASRTDLSDRVASDFNQAFYLRIKAGKTVPEAYRIAMQEVRFTHPAADWAALLLLRAAPWPVADGTHH